MRLLSLDDSLKLPDVPLVFLHSARSTSQDFPLGVTIPPTKFDYFLINVSFPSSAGLDASIEPILHPSISFPSVPKNIFYAPILYVCVTQLFFIHNPPESGRNSQHCPERESEKIKERNDNIDK
jgi:hypothetical protein